MTAHTRDRSRQMAIAAALVLLTSAPLFAQDGPPIPGVTGAKEAPGGGGSDAVWAGVEKAAEGTRKLLGAIGIGKNDSEARADLLKSLEAGATVTVRYYAKGADLRDLSQTEPQKTTEGRVIELDRKTGVIVVRLADRTTERLRIAERKAGAADVSATQDSSEVVVISYVDGSGDRVMIPFRKAS
jgi:hypothetical protein